MVPKRVVLRRVFILVATPLIKINTLYFKYLICDYFLAHSLLRVRYCWVVEVDKVEVTQLVFESLS